MTVDLSAFALVAGSKADRTSAQPDADAAYHALANALLAVLDHGEACAAATDSAARIAARLDDPAVAGTAAQRTAAEAAHWSRTQTAKRERDALRRAARAVGRLWPDAPPDTQAAILNDFPRGWRASPCWELLHTDQTVAPLEPWAALLRARIAALRASDEPCPF